MKSFVANKINSYGAIDFESNENGITALVINSNVTYLSDDGDSLDKMERTDIWGNLSDEQKAMVNGLFTSVKNIAKGVILG